MKTIENVNTNNLAIFQAALLVKPSPQTSALSSLYAYGIEEKVDQICGKGKRIIRVARNRKSSTQHLQCSRLTAGLVICVSIDLPKVRFSFPVITMSGSVFASPIFRFLNTIDCVDDIVAADFGILAKQVKKQQKFNEAMKVRQFDDDEIFTLFYLRFSLNEL